MRGGVDEDEGSCAAVVLVAVGEKGGGGFDSDAGHVVHANGDIFFDAVQGVDVDAVEHFRDFGLDVPRGVTQYVAGGGIERGFAQPAKARIEGLGALGLVVGADEHVSSAEVDVVREGHGDA